MKQNYKYSTKQLNYIDITWIAKVFFLIFPSFILDDIAEAYQHPTEANGTHELDETDAILRGILSNPAVTQDFKVNALTRICRSYKVRSAIFFLNKEEILRKNQKFGRIENIPRKRHLVPKMRKENNGGRFPSWNGSNSIEKEFWDKKMGN